MKVLFTNRLDSMWFSKIEELRREFPNVEFVTFKDVPNSHGLLKEADVVVGGHFSEEEIENAKNLKIIFVPWAGVNTIPWNVIKRKKIAVANTHANAKSVAEHAVALAIALMHRVVEYHNDLSKGVWHGFPVGAPYSDYWTPMCSKTCAVMGFGNIGKRIAKMLKAFDCRVIAFKKHISSTLEYADEVSFDIDYTISKSDVIFLALPLTPDTEGMFNWNVLSKMNGKFLISVSRGGLIVEEALYRALKERILSGAALDTWYQYPNSKESVTLPSAYPIHTFRNVVLSPHISGVTKESTVAMLEDTIENLKRYLESGEFSNAVDPNLMY